MARSDKPNFAVPLAYSYNERGIRGLTNSITNSQDQRKVNLYYEVATNHLGDSNTVTLSLRPGFTADTERYGVSSQVAYLIGKSPQFLSTQAGQNLMVFTTSTATGVDVHTSSATTTFESGSQFYPAYLDQTAVNTVNNSVIQVAQYSAFTGAQKTYYSSSFPTFTQIVSTFTTFTHVGKMEFMDGFGFILDKSNNRIQNSNVNTISTWPADNYITKQIKQDNPHGLARFQNKIVAFGRETAECFYNGGLTPAPLVPIKTLEARIGLAPRIIDNRNLSGHYYTILGNRMFFLGFWAGVGIGSLTSFDGSRFEKVSPPYIDKIIQDSPDIGSIESFSFGGQQTIAITLQSASTSPKTWLMFFPEVNEWFEWNSICVTPINSGGRFVGAGNFSDITGQFVITETFQDFGSSYPYISQFQIPSDGSYKKMPMFGVVADTLTSTHNMTVEFNDADGVSSAWVTTATLDLSLGRKMAFRGGGYRERLVRLSGTSSTEQVRLHKFIARVEE